MTAVIEPKPSSTAWAKSLLTGILAGILFATLTVALVVWGVTGTGLFRLLRSYAQGSVIHIDQPTVVRQIQQLQRLETVRFSMDKIISGLHDRSISLRLPKSQILLTRIDNSRTRVYSRDTGLFSSPDPNLESQVRQEAERELQEAALQDNILKTADDNARTTLSALLRSLGFTNVEFV